MKYLHIFFLLFLTGCNNDNDNLDLEIISKKLNYIVVEPNEYYNYMTNSIKLKKSKTIIVYKLTNNSDKSYYFNLDSYNENLEENAVKISRSFVSIIDNSNNKVKVYNSSPTGNTFSQNNYKKMILLDYHNHSLISNNNFIIHPKETLYFEWFIILPYGNFLEEHNYQVNLDKNQKYFAELLLYSDGVNYKKQISRTDLKTIEENGYEVYNGVIKSKNKIPIVFNNP